jgi:hypothetical protein
MKESVTENKTLTVTGCDIKGFSSIGNRLKKNTSQNKTLDDPDFVVKGLNYVIPRRKRKQDLRQRCYVNNMEIWRKETSEDLIFQVRYD